MGLDPSYIVEMLIPYEPVRRFSGGALMVISKLRLKSKGDLKDI